jgi:Asp-tRNA(Asn)/Glu-tRNA(Gln) amidotransferase C subunit
MNDKNLEKFFKISKLKYHELQLTNVLNMIESINKINEDELVGESFYEKSWIKMKLREDTSEEDQKAKNFGQKKGNLFLVPAVI